MFGFRKLFKKAEEYAEYASEVLAPTYRTKLEHFQNNWMKVNEFIVDRSIVPGADLSDAENPDAVFVLLDEMLSLLKVEEQEQEEGMGQCLEFLLEKKILRTMVSVGQGDFPRGIMSEVLKFYTSLLSDIKDTQLIPHQNVYNPMKKLMHVFSKNGCKDDTEEALIGYLEALCIKLAQSPYLSELFTETETSAAAADDGTRNINFLPLLVLKHLFGTQKPAVFQRAAECLKMIIALQTETINTVLLRTGVAADVMAHRLIELQAALPMEMENEDTHQHIVEWMTNQYDGWKRFTPEKYAGLEEECLAFLAFMDFIHYCDDVLEDCNPNVAQHIVDTIRARLLEQAVGPMLMQHSEDVACTATSYVIACVNQVSSPHFLQGFTTFLFGDGTEGGKSKMGDMLVQRCDDISDELSLVTLHLFLRMLMKRDVRVVQTLILRYAEADGTNELASQISLPALQAAMKAEAEGMLEKIPEDLRSGDLDDSYKAYFIDAQEKIWECRNNAARWNPVRMADSSLIAEDEDEGPDFSVEFGDDDHDHEADPVDDADGTGTEAAKELGQPAAGGGATWTGTPCKSPLIGVLLRRLRSMPTQAYSMNLLITANFAALFEFTHPALQSILLSSGEDGLAAAYSQLCAEIKSKSCRIDNVEDRLRNERSQLTMSEEDHTRDSTLPAIKTLQSIILLEEFAKEVASRLFVQCNEMLLEA